MIWRSFPCAAYLFTVSFCIYRCLASARSVNLTSSVEQNGRQAACPGEEVTFTCVVTDGAGLQWIAEPYISQSGNNRIIFLPSKLEDMVIEQFRAVIIGSTLHGFFGDFTSNLIVTTSEELDETVVQCTDTTPNVMGKLLTLTLAVPPSPPQQPRYSVTGYHLNDFTVAVQWESPASDGGGGIDSYALTGAGITAPLTVLSNEPLMTTLILSYNEMHMVSITASNCAGESTASVVTVHEESCGLPIPPPRGSLGDLNSSQEGTVVTFQCNPGLVPSQQMMSACAANGSWTPNPAELVCKADCGDPSHPVNGFVMAYNSTLESSQIVFQCSPGFIPEQMIMISNCAANGSWTPDPTGLVCREPADCGDPSIPMNGFVLAYNSTLEGSQIVFRCSPGFAPSHQMMSDCAANGSWTPDPAELVCRVDCGIPVIVNGSVNYTTTVEGSTATYQCGIGLIPVRVITSMCTGNGEWAPDPADAGCRLPADCGIPVIVNGSVNYTTTVEGSTATYQCGTGMIPVGVMTAVCMESGEWVPDPADVGCELPVDCGIPIIVDGSVNYTTTVEGSTATYQCDTGLVPVGVMTAICMENGEWAPDPSCRLPGQDTTTSTPSESSNKLLLIAVPAAVATVAVVVVFTTVICICWRKRSSGAFVVKATATDETLPESTYDYATVTTNVNLEMDSLPTTGFYDLPDTKKPPSKEPEDITYDDADSKKQPPLQQKPELLYAALQIDPAPAHAPPPAPPDAIQYAQIVPQSVPINTVHSVVPIDTVHSADKLLNLDTVLAQLAAVQESWYELGTGLGVPATTLDTIKSQCPSSQDSLIETVDSWMRGHEGTPMWRNITAVLRQINFQSLAASIDQVYVTGELPTPFDNEVPSLALGNPGGFGTPEGPPPPIPTRMNSLDELAPPKPPPSREGQESRTPPQPSRPEPYLEPELAVPPHIPKSTHSAPPKPTRNGRRI